MGSATMQLDASTPLRLDNILLATDFSSSSGAALHYTLALARRRSAHVFLVHIVQPQTYEMLSSEMQRRALDDAWREAHRCMTDLLIAGQLDGIDHRLMVEKGEVWEVLSGLLRQLDIHLLVTGTRGRTRFTKLFLGSVAETIFRQAECPVLTVGPKAGEVPAAGPQRILFATGFSKHSLHAGGTALALARAQQAKLIILNVQTEGARSPGREADALQRLRSLIPPNAILPEDPTFIVEFGPAGERILAAAEAQKPDLIVLGIRQPTGFALRLRWATAYEVAVNASCPVLTVRSPESS